ncbi:MAG: VWA domain-containing protein [Myxococcales bacterium]|nr:VWA domain-containing protein [Myxococcales bacterium]
MSDIHLRRTTLLRGVWVAVLSVMLAGCNCSTPPSNPDGGGGGTGGGVTGGGTGGGGGGGAGGGGTGGGGTIIVDPNDPQNPLKDSDCDGLNDAEEFGNIYPGGKRTNPANPDTDSDGIIDGIEAGRVSSVDPRCTFAGDADPTSRTNPTETDSDGDGIPDGTEDVDHNGRAEPTETDANNPDTDFDGLNDGAEDANHNGAVDAGETDPRRKDTDGDFINDGVEVTVTMTDPLRNDTDGDTCLDGAEDANQNGTVDTGETDPNLATDCGPSNNPDSDMDGLPNRVEDKNQNGTVDPGETDPMNADTDGDGLRDGVEDASHNGFLDPGETNPLRRDTDCDGLLDGPTQGMIRGEDQNANGMVDLGETDPRRLDTDGDGLSDGVETGLVTANIADATLCMNVPVDLDPGTTTNPTNRDSDGDGIDDGAEDTNQNGRVDPGELDPNNMADGTGPAGQVCTVMNLRPVLFRGEALPDLQLGLPATYTEIRTMSVGGSVKGLIGFDPMNGTAFLAWRQAAPGMATTPTDDEAALKPVLAGLGALSNEITQTFTSWDAIPALQAFYDQAAGADVKTHANAIAEAMVGTGAGSLMGAGGGTGPFKVQVEYLHRTNSAVVVIVALTPLAAYNGAPLFVMSDTAGGSAVAQFGDYNAYQCETFAPASGKVDFLVVVDDSCSMAGSQQALADAAGAMATALGNSTLDWRIALVTSEYHLTGTSNNRSVRRGFTRNINQFRAWLTQNSTCTGGTCRTVPMPFPACDSNGGDPNGANGGCWVGIGGSGTEGVLGAARKSVDDVTVLPLPMTEQVNRVRSDAQLAVIILGDADDQTSGYTSTGSPRENIQNFVTFFTAQGTGTKNRLNVNVPVHAIVCPTGANCNGETQNNPQRTPQVTTATGGIRGAINNTASIQTTMAAIVQSSIAAAGYRMQKPPIGASVKVAMDVVLDGTMCNKDDIPRSRMNGFDFDGINRTISFFGACRPGSTTMAAAVSYRYWVDNTPNPSGNPPPCSQDTTYYDPADPDFCRGRLACNFMTNVCECPANCGGTPPPGRVCDTNRLVCDYVCTQDCGGTCSPFQQCNVTACACECKQTASCPPGYRFQNGAGVCGCVCDTAALNCGPTYDADPATCTCVCKPNCGGCQPGDTCNQSVCSCTGGIN